MSDKALQLTDAQRAGIERTDLSMAVTSGAGCGKTFVLARRYLKVLADDGRPDAPSRVVAVTFTDKAAIEMRQRVGELLAERIGESRDADTKALLAEWLSRLPDARISTIHGFCASVLRAHAIEAGVDPSFAVGADEFLLRRLLADAVSAAAKEAFDDPDDTHLELLDSFRYQQILDMLAAAVKERWRWSAKGYADPATTLERWAGLHAEACEKSWAAFDNAELRADLADLAEAPCDDPTDKLAIHLAEQLDLMTTLLDDPLSRTPETMDRLASAGGKGGAGAWGSAETAKAVRARFRGLLERFRAMAVYCRPLGECDRRAARCLAALTALAADAAGRFEAAKRRAGVLDFDDLLIRTRDLLVARPDVRRRVAEGIDQMLIDEFQDTDSLQHELLYLAVDCVDGSPSPGRMFFVGDAKQSIYRFRGAEVEVFNAARRRIAAEGQCSLDLNFRTHSAGLALVNRIFTPLMGEAYAPLSAHRTERPELPAAELLLVECEDKAAARLQATARAMATRIAGMVADGEKRVWDAAAETWRPVRFGDIAILLPRLRNTAPYEDALRDAGVDYYVVSGTGLFRQQEVFDLCNALRAIDNPLDDIALMGFLRGGMVGLDDNVLAHIAAAAPPPYRRRLRDAAVFSALGDGDRAALAAATELLDRLAGVKDSCAIDELIERLLAATGFEATLLGGFHGHRKCGNLHRVLAHARQAQQAGATLGEFVDFLSELTIEEIRAEQAATDAESGDVVRLMTVHKAKGLEFPVVFLADLNYAPVDQSPTLSLRGPWGLTLRVDDSEDGDQAVSWRLARQVERAADMAEDHRQFYVAVTRHEDYIVLVGGLQWVDEDCLGKAGSPLRWLDDTLGVAAALDSGRIELGDGAEAAVHVVDAEPTRAEAGASALDVLLARSGSPDELATRLAAPDQAEQDPLPYLTGAETAGIERIGVTPLATFAWCPAAYRWRHELRVPVDALAAAAGTPATAAPAEPVADRGLDAATAGTVFHRCMELLDFRRPQPASALIRQALADLSLAVDPAPLADELAAMLTRLEGHALWPMLVASQSRLAELAFTTRMDRLILDGVIDLLVRDGDGRWRIIDYKSDRVAAGAVASHAERYALQMHIYAAAAARYLGAEQAGDGIDATLYFLRCGATHVFAAAELTFAAAEQKVADLAERLAGCRRSSIWPRRDDASCDVCRYGPLCGRKSDGTNRLGAV